MTEGKRLDNEGKVNLLTGRKLVKEGQFACMLFFGYICNNFLVDFIVPILQESQRQCLSLKNIDFEIPQQVFQDLLTFSIQQIRSQLDDEFL